MAIKIKKIATFTIIILLVTIVFSCFLTNVHASTSLPNSVLGDDYLIWGNWNGNPSFWVTAGALGANGLNSTATPVDWFTYFGCNTAKLSFSFSDDVGSDKDSTYTYAKMNAVLGYLNAVGVKAILCDFAGSGSYFYGSTAWVNDWKQVATDFKGDARIASFEFVGEPNQDELASNANTLSTFDSACASLITQVRAIDPSRTIIYPVVVGFLTTNPTTFYSDVFAKGITSDGNIEYDIVHPYYFEDSTMDAVTNPTGDADWYWNTYCLPQISYFGASNCFCGETFPWGPGGYNGITTIHSSYQQTFEIRIINYLVGQNIGFQMWDFFSSTAQYSDVYSLENSNYIIHGGIQTPVPTATNNGGGGGGEGTVVYPTVTPTSSSHIISTNSTTGDPTELAIVIIIFAMFYIATKNKKKKS